MGRYLEFYAGEISPGYVNKSSDIHTIQYGNIAAFVQLLNDEFGNFELTGLENAFKLTPALNLIDQANIEGYEDYKNISTDYHRQPLFIEKSSIEEIYLYFRNDGSETVPVSIDIRQPPFENSEGEIYASATVNITHGTAGEIAFPLEVHHLSVGKLYLIIKINDSENQEVYVRTDSSGGYCNGLATSDDDYEYDEIGGDLWFRTTYGNERTFDIQSSIAVVNGVKLINLDTHVTIPAASQYGDRIDYVCLSEQGILEVLTGDVSNRPVPPDGKLSPSYLKIAQVKVIKGKSNSQDMKVDQDDSQGKYRTRSLLERVRRLEKFSKHVQDHYSPERAKYDVEPPVMYEGDDGSYNMVWDDDLQAFRLSEQNSLSKIWTFKDDTNLNLNKTSQIDHSDHTKGEVKLAMTTVERQVAGASRQRSGGSDRTVGGNVWDVEYKEFGANVFSKAYANNGATSDYPAIFTYIPAAGYLVRVGTDHHIFENVANVGCWFFKADGMVPLQQGSEYNVSGQSTYTTVYGRTFQQFIGKWGEWNHFPGTLWVTPGWYAMVFYPTPLNGNRASIIHSNTWNDAGWPIDYKNFTYFGEFSGGYPFNPWGISLTRRLNAQGHGVVLRKAVYLSKGTIQSSSISSHIGIESVTMDMNMTLPEGTSYTLEVSNDGGRNFYEMHGKVHNFAQSGGKEFVWRLNLYTSNEDNTPVLKYLDVNGFALKAELSLHQGEVLRGCLVTTPFDGYEIAKALLRMGEPKFSRWEWVRLWATGPKTKEEEEELGIKMRISIEVSDDGVEWQKTKADMSLEDFFNGSVDFSYYEGSYDEDEFNYWADTDQEIQKDTILIEPFNVKKLQSNQVDNISIDLVDGTNVINLSDTAEPGLLASMPCDLDLSNYTQLELIISSESYIEFGEMELYLFADSNFGNSGQAMPPLLGRYTLPYVENDGDTQRVIYTLDNPEDLENVRAISIGTIGDYNPIQMSFALDEINGLTTEKYPFFERFLRLRICMERPLTGVVSPTVRKIGVIPIFS